MDVVQLLLRLLLFIFVFENTALQELREIIFAELVFVRLSCCHGGWLAGRHGIVLRFTRRYLFFEHLHLCLVLGDDALAEVRTLSKFVLYLGMLLKFHLEQLDLAAHLFILIGQLLYILTLVVELARQLDVLLLGQLGSAFEVLLVHGQHLNLDVPDREQHLLAQLVDLGLSFLLDRLQIIQVSLLTCSQSLFKFSFLLLFFTAMFEPQGDVVQRLLLLGNISLVLGHCSQVVGVHLGFFHDHVIAKLLDVGRELLVEFTFIFDGALAVGNSLSDLTNLLEFFVTTRIVSLNGLLLLLLEKSIVHHATRKKVKLAKFKCLF